MTASTILLLGRTGQIGQELHPRLARIGPVVAPDRKELDLARPDSIREVVRATAPRLIVNAAAYTDVDGAESETDAAHTVNGIGPGVLAEEASRLGARLVHFSTDYVFDGEKSTPYTEDDPPNPLNVYGSSKLEGEEAIRQGADRYMILRTSWIYGLHGRNFLRTILRLARERDEIRVVDDQFGAPTPSWAVAEAVCRIIEDDRDATGLYHVSCAGQTSWYGFARSILAQLPDERGAGCRVIPIPASEYPARVKRPRWSVLSNLRLERTFGFTIPDWTEALVRTIRSRAASNVSAS